MGTTRYPPETEMELLRQQVADLARELTERDQALRHQHRQMDGELQDLREQSDMLRAIITGTAAETGEDFFQTLVVHLCSVFGVQYAIVGEVRSSDAKTIRTIAVSSGGSLIENFEYPLLNTPCELALAQYFACFEQVRAAFPSFERLDQLSVESYCGVPLSAKDGTVLGLLVIMDTKPLRKTHGLKSLMTVFASRAGAELQRRQMENELRHQHHHLLESQAQLHFGSWDWELPSGNVWWSDEQYRLFGHEPGTIPATHETFLKAIHPDDRNKVRGAIDAALAGRVRFDIDCRIVRPNREVRTLNCRGVVYRNPDGHPVSMTGSMLDITDQKRVEEALRTSQEKFRQALHASGTGLWDWNTVTNEVIFSEEWVRQLGYESGELTGSFETWASLLHPEDRDRAIAYVKAYVNHGQEDYRQEFRLRQKNGAYRWIESRASFVTEADGRRIRLLGSHTDITDRKQMEEKVRESEEQYRTLVELSPSGVFVFCEGRTVYVNHTGAVLMGANDVQEIIERPTFDFIHPDYHQEVRENVKRLLSGGVSVQSAERTYLKLDGTPIPVQVEAARITWNGKPAILGLFSDIRERKMAQEAVASLNVSLEREVSERTEALRRSEERFRQFFDNAPNVTCLKDHDGRYLYTNRRFDEVFGFSSGMAVGKTDEELFSPKQAVQFRSHDRQVLTSGRGEEFEEVTEQIDGLHTSIVVKFPVTNTGGDPSAIGVIATDITERKRTQDQLKLYQEIFTHSIDGIAIIDPQGRYVEQNKAHAQMLGYAWDELKETTPAIHLGAETFANIAETLADTGIYRGVVESRTKSGRMLTIDLTSFSVRDTHGQPLCYVRIKRDITERTRAEEALRESQARFQQFAESVGSAFLIADVSTDSMEVMYVNAAFTFIWGIERDEICRNGALWLDSIHPDDRDRVKTYHEQFLVGGMTAVFYCEYRIVGRDGYIRWIADRRVRMTGWENRIAGIAEDITSHKQQLALMKQTEAIGKIGGWELDIVTNRLQWSEETYRLHDTTPDTYSPTVETALHFYTSDSRPRIAEALKKGIAEGVSWDLELELVTAMGQQIAVRSAGKMDMVNGRAVRAYGTFQDITERKRAEDALQRAHAELERKVVERTAALRASEERYARATAIGKVGVWELDVVTGHYHGDANLKALFGYGPEELSSDPFVWLGVVHPDDQPVAMKNWDLIQSGATDECHYELRMVRKDGSIIWTDVRCHALRDQNGRVTRLIGATVDVTERKEVEQALRASEELFSKAFRSSPDPMTLVELETGRWLDVNDACLTALGYQREQVVRRKGDEIEHWLTPDDQIRFMERLRREGSIRNFEAVFQTACGERRDYLVSAERIEYHGKPCMITVSKDITKRKQAEQALWKSQQAIRALHDISSAQGQSFEGRVEALLQLGCRILDLPIGLETVVRGEELEVKQVHAPGSRFHQGLRVPLDKTYCAEALRRNGLLSFEHVGASAEWQRHPAYAALKLESYIGTVIRGLERTYGTLCFAGVEPRKNDFTEYEKDFVQLMARWLGGELDRQVALDALLESEERYRTLYDETPSMYFTVDGAGIIRSVNQYGAQYLGYRVEDLVGKPVQTIFFEEDRARVCAEMEAFFRQPVGVAQWEFRKLRGDGTILWVREFARVLCSRDGEPLALIVCDDITESKRMEQALRLTQFSVDQAVEAILWLDPTARFFNVNDTACRMLGYSREELTSMTVHDIDPNFPVQRWAEHWVHLKERRALAFEAKYRSRTGTVLEMEVTFNYLQYDGKEYGCAILRDIGERKQAEAERRRSHAFLRQVIDTDPGLIFAKDREGRYAMANQAIAECYGTTADDLVGKFDADFNVNMDEVKFFREHDLAVMNSGAERFIREEKLTDVTGHTRWLQTVKRPIFDDDGQVHLVLGAATDITERKRMEEELLQRERDLNAALQERERISEDLHDGILQSLYAVGLGLEGCKPMITQQPEPMAAKLMSTLDQTIGQLNHVMGEVRNFIAGLESHVIQGGDVPTALRTMVQTMSSSSRAKCLIRIDEAAARRLSTEQALHVINIVREGLSNAVRHSRATRIVVSLRELVRTVRLTIRDNGIGFNIRSAQGVGHGLGNMAARAQKVRGSFSLQSKPWKGTTISLDLPKDSHHAHN